MPPPTQTIDVFFEMALNKWPIFDSKTLANSKVVLLQDLKPMIDMFNAEGVGLGIRKASEVISELGLNEHDRKRLVALMNARSFDVYSVRAALSDLLSDTELERIKIPKAEEERLQQYMTNYSRGLLKVILEGTDIKVTSRSSLSTILEGANRGAIIRNLMDIAGKLRIEPAEIVLYISKLSEIILAISYYQRIYDAMLPDLREMLKDVKTLHDQPGLQSRFPGVREDTQEALDNGRNTIVTLNGYFDLFHKVEKFFDDITPEKFKSMRDAVEVHYRAIGMIVCFWQIKINEWRRRSWDERGRRRDSTIEQKYNFFKDTIYHNLYTIADNLELLKEAKLDI